MSENKYQIQRWVIPAIAAVVFLAVVGGLVYFYQSKGKAQHAPTAVKALSDDRKAPVVGGAGTDKYNKELRGYEVEESMKAAKEGRTRVSTPVGKAPAPIEEKDVVTTVDAPKVPPEKVRTRAPKAEDRARVQQLAEMQKSLEGAIKSEMQMINTVMDKNYPGPTVMVFEATAGQKGEGGNPNNNESEYGTTNQQDVVFTPFEVGEVLYAMNTVSINSDVPGPAMIELVTGRLKGGKFIGNFVRHNKHLLLKFSVFSYEGKTYPVEALAVDPATSGVAMRSDFDSHYVERWGGLVAASFLEGFAEAVSGSGLSTESTAVGVIVDHPVYSTADQMWIAAGKVGENLAEPMLQNFYRPPTVYLEPGTEIGILIVKN